MLLAGICRNMKGLFMKFSKQRELILNQVKRFPIHPTADEVYTALKKDNPNLSLGTVYRNLNLLCETGELMKIRIADGKDRFDGRTDKHYHMVCDDCGRVYDIELDLLDGIEQRILSSDGHVLTNVTLNLNGICCGCMAQRNSESG